MSTSAAFPWYELRGKVKGLVNTDPIASEPVVESRPSRRGPRYSRFAARVTGSKRLRELETLSAQFSRIAAYVPGIDPEDAAEIASIATQLGVS